MVVMSFFVHRSFEKILALYCVILCIYEVYKNIISDKEFSILTAFSNDVSMSERSPECKL